ncbi:MAG: hypothetical protein J2O48_01880 [Solirubrobacterales bacterium]|nr:hypothetical protein [Solirubrobacterales bacterium]
MIAVVAILIGAVIVAVPNLGRDVGHGLECIVGEIFKTKDCVAEDANIPVGTQTAMVGDNGHILIFDGNHQYQATVTYMKNGTAKITLLNLVKVGVSGGPSAGVSGGEASADVGVSVGAGLQISNATTWTIPNWKLAKSDYNQITSVSGGDMMWKDVTGIFGKSAPDEHSLPSNLETSHMSGLGGYAMANGEANAEATSNASAGAKLGVNLSASDSKIDQGSQNGDHEIDVNVSGDGDASLGVSLFGKGAEAGGSGNASAGMSVVRDSQGKPISVTVTDTVAGTYSYSDPTTEVTLPSPKKSQKPTKGATGGAGEENGSGAGTSSDAKGGSAKGGSGETGSGGSKQGAKEDAPLLHYTSSDGDQSGAGTTFTGSLDLTHDPKAQSDVEQVLAGHAWKIPTVVSDINHSGTEQTQHFQQSTDNHDSSLGGHVAVVGFQAGTQNDHGTTCTTSVDNRSKGGAWSHQNLKEGPTCPS